MEKQTIYTVATAHLDTIWNWSFETTLQKYLPKTMERNFRYFEKYPIIGSVLRALTDMN